MKALAHDVTELRLVGRGGAGVVTAGELLGKAAVFEGGSAQAIPAFGPERRGALCLSTVRISEETILLKCAAAHPRVLLVLDATIWRHAPVTGGLADGAALIFNSPVAPNGLADELNLDCRAPRIFSVDATGIALSILERPITNTTMLGALVRATGLVRMESLEQVLAERFGAAAESNIAAARAGAAQLQGPGA
ncbi:MAG: 2-oxoacid:acceptor oxidoreductase family protein [Planctomycetota bacterium]|jgi:pyruvate ferredoxin oxidoreductase gamma subunit